MGNKALRCDGYIFTKVLQYNNSINWRCSLYKKFKCKARAITEFDKVGWVRLTQREHTHTKADYRSSCFKFSSSKIFGVDLPPLPEVQLIVPENIPMSSEGSRIINESAVMIPVEDIKTEILD